MRRGFDQFKSKTSKTTREKAAVSTPRAESILEAARNLLEFLGIPSWGAATCSFWLAMLSNGGGKRFGQRYPVALAATPCKSLRPLAPWRPGRDSPELITFKKFFEKGRKSFPLVLSRDSAALGIASGPEKGVLRITRDY